MLFLKPVTSANGKSKQKIWKTVAEWLHIPPQNLRYGVELEKRVQQARTRWDEAIGYQERELFEAYLTLPVPQRKIVREVIFTFVKAYPEKVIAKSG